MEYVYAAMLIHSAGREITGERVTDVLESAGVEIDESRVDALIAALEDIDIEEAISQGAAAPAPGAGTPAPEAEEEEEEEEEEEAEEEEEEEEAEEAAEGLGSLFG